MQIFLIPILKQPLFQVNLKKIWWMMWVYLSESILTSIKYQFFSVCIKWCYTASIFETYTRLLYSAQGFCVFVALYISSSLKCLYCRDVSRVSNRTWTQTVNQNEPFHFGEPEPNLNQQKFTSVNLNQQKFTSVNLNQTWTLKIVLKWTQSEPKPLTKVRIYFSISGCRWRWYTHNNSSGDHQLDQQFLLFFFLDETSNDS